MKKKFLMAFVLSVSTLSLIMLSSCSSTKVAVPTPDSVELERFMGAWYVHGYTPIIVDKDAHNAVEHYARGEGDKILTTYAFRKGSFDGKLKTFTPTGFVHDEETQAEWRMQFIWPFRAEYFIHYVSPDYSETIIAHPNREYAWLMSRSPSISEEAYQALLNRLEQIGYDLAVIQRVPHDWSKEGERLAEIEQAGAREPLAER